MTSPFGELIASGEGSYNSYNRGTVKDKSGAHKIVPAGQQIDFSEMTVEELQRRQALPPGDLDRVFAVGKYQFIRSTLRDGVEKIKIEPSEKFTPELQERLFSEYLLRIKNPKIYAYISGAPNATLRDAQKSASREWASVEDPDTPGHVYAKYEEHGNKMHTTAAQVAAALDEMRIEYQAKIDKGLSAEAAWQATMTMGPGQFQHVAKAHVAGHRAAGSLLAEGTRGPAVGELQTHLSKLGYANAQGQPLAVDNDFGRNTRQALEAFQRDQGLSVDGVAGPRTWTALREATRMASVTEPSITFPQMAAPDLDAAAITALQQQLHTLGMTDHRGQPLPVTGAYDDTTRMTVMQFQKDQGLPATGLADPGTRALIEARATIAELQQRAHMQTAPLSEAPWLGMPMHASPPTHGLGYRSPTPEMLPEPVASSHHRDAEPGLDAITAIQAQLQEMQRQMEAMSRQREREHEREKAQEDPRARSNEPLRDTRYEAQRQETHTALAAESLSYSHPDHPQHALYARLKALLPEGTSEARLEQSTAACCMGRITQPEQLHEIHIGKGAVHFLSNQPHAHASIDMTQPAPTVHQTMQQVQAFDQQQAQMWGQFEAQQAQINMQHGAAARGPVLQ